MKSVINPLALCLSWLTFKFRSTTNNQNFESPQARPRSVRRKRSVTDFERVLGIEFKDNTLIHEALTHSSFINENPGTTLTSYQRLEFLGDAVLGSIIALDLFLRFPRLGPGELTSLRAGLVQSQSLAEIASGLDLGDYLDMGRGEEANGGRTRRSNLEDALEAVLGAIYLDQGLDITRRIVLEWMGDKLTTLDCESAVRHPKSLLQEMVQAQKGRTPKYQVSSVCQLDGAQIYTIDVIIGEHVMGTGVGASKSEAEKLAASHALEQFFDA